MNREPDRPMPSQKPAVRISVGSRTHRLIAEIREGFADAWLYTRTILKWGAVACIVCWVLSIPFGLWVAPRLRATYTHSGAAPTGTEVAVQTGAVDVLAALAAPEARTEFYKGFNLAVYINRSTIERIPFPDREGFVKGSVGGWCAAIDSQSPFDFPGVSLRDIRSGKELAHYGCFRKRVSLID